jgi:DNA-binding CsgD family transcriptional regulator
MEWIVEPMDAEFPDSRERFARCMHEHPFLNYYREHPDESALRLSDFVSRRQLHDLALYSDFYRIARVEYLIGCHLATRRGMQMVVGLCRQSHDFSDQDRRLLEMLDPHLAQAYGNAECREQLKAEMELLHRSLDQLERGVVSARADGSIRMQTAEARRLLDKYFGESVRDRDRLPGPLRLWLAREDALAAGSAASHEFMLERGDATLVVRRIVQDGPVLLIIEERRARLSPSSLVPLGLSQREAEVLCWAAEGKTDGDIAVILGISFRTVKKHLGHVYAKLGVENRTAAAAIARRADEPSSRNP